MGGRSARHTTRSFAARWRRERPEAIMVSSERRGRGASLRLGHSGADALRTCRSSADVSRSHVRPSRSRGSRSTIAAARRSEGTVSAVVSILHCGRRRIARASIDRVVGLPIGERARAWPLQIAVRRCAAESCRFASTHTAARRNRAHVALLHRLPQTCGLLLERHRARYVVMSRSKEAL